VPPPAHPHLVAGRGSAAAYGGARGGVGSAGLGSLDEAVALNTPERWILPYPDDRLLIREAALPATDHEHLQMDIGRHDKPPYGMCENCQSAGQAILWYGFVYARRRCAIRA
jgi:hypothetical protein